MEDCSSVVRKKRNFLLDLNVDSVNQMLVSVPRGFQNDVEMVASISSLSSLLENDFLKQEKPMLTSVMSRESTSGQIGFPMGNFEQRRYKLEVDCSNRDGFFYLPGTRCQYELPFQDKFRHALGTIVEHETMESAQHLVISRLHFTLDNSEVNHANKADDVNDIVTRDLCDSVKLGIDKQTRVSRVKVGAVPQGLESSRGDLNEKSKEMCIYDIFRCRSKVENQQVNTIHAEGSKLDNHEKNVAERFDLNLIPVNPETGCGFQSQVNNVLTQIMESSIPNLDQKDDIIEVEKIHPTMDNYNAPPQPWLQQVERDKKPIQVKQKLKDSQNASSKEKRETHMEKSKKAPSTNNNNAQKPYPDFESFAVEEEEGSGGYGTVYRAKRKADGQRFAIKCPHANANRSHVQNELKMLERLGGKNFVIKCEGSLKYGNSDCLVLEHVDHDRPEVLKREINIVQLQWYGYCMFKALANLHRQGVVHRDVKPGNFLFSRKINKGYLIDFNLALDLHKKLATFDSLKPDLSPKYDHIPIPQTKSLPPEKIRKSTSTRFPETVFKNTVKSSKSALPTSDLQKTADKAKALINNINKNFIKSQGADGSGLTSTKESAKTQLGGRLREPLPSQGRRELISLVQKVLHGEKHEYVSTNISKRKRVEAPRGDAYSKFLYPTPMPLHANGSTVAGAGSLKIDDSKQRREGPCAGTKGFKAPEVLFRSLHQGPKVDIWSAGVSLLYLIIGRTPFAGDTDQNLKEIAKLRGSEDLWEVAKLHNQESSFPMDLFDVKYLSPVKLRDWCARNTRRPDFLEAIPSSLFDLLDKCLTVNPRCRITAEEALGHDFFAPCFEIIRRKHKKQRQGLSIDAEMTSLQGQ